MHFAGKGQPYKIWMNFVNENMYVLKEYDGDLMPNGM